MEENNFSSLVSTGQRSKGKQSICLLLLSSPALLSACASESPGCPMPALLDLLQEKQSGSCNVKNTAPRDTLALFTLVKCDLKSREHSRIAIKYNTQTLLKGMNIRYPE